MLQCIYGADGFEPEEDEEEKKDPHVGRHIECAEDDDEQNDNLQIRNETHNQRMKRIAETCDKERDEKKKLKLEVQV